MSARQAATYSNEILTNLGDFLGADSKTPKFSRMARDERARVEDLRDDIRSLDGSHFLPVAPGFRFVFSGFERVLSVVSRHSRRTRNLPAHNDSAMIPEGSGAFADDYATFDRLSIHYGGLFRGSVIVNYLLGVVAVGFTVSSILPQPRFVSPSGVWLFPEFAGFAAAFELLCIVMIGVIFFTGRHPNMKLRGSCPPRILGA